MDGCVDVDVDVDDDRMEKRILIPEEECKRQLAVVDPRRNH